MPRRLRILVLLVVLTAWLAVVAAYLVKGELPDYKLLGIPAVIVAALWPPKRKPKDDDE